MTRLAMIRLPMTRSLLAATSVLVGCAVVATTTPLAVTKHSAFAPGTGTPEIGGYTPHEAQRMLRGLRGLNLVGGDVVEVSPPFDMSGNTALVGVTMMWEILCLLAEAIVGLVPPRRGTISFRDQRIDGLQQRQPTQPIAQHGLHPRAVRQPRGHGVCR